MTALAAQRKLVTDADRIAVSRRKCMLTPNDTAVAKPEMRTAFLFPPHRRIESGGAIIIARDTPAGTFVGKKIHM